MFGAATDCRQRCPRLSPNRISPGRPANPLLEFMARFGWRITWGGDAFYYFHYFPMGIHPGCNRSPGTFGMFSVDANYNVQQPLSQYFASQLLTQEWVVPGDGVHRTFPAVSDVVDLAGHVLVTAYAVLRPDGTWALLLINKDQENAHSVRISFGDEGGGKHFSGDVSVSTFGVGQYVWHPEIKGGWADPDGPAARTTVRAGRETQFVLPQASVSVIRGRIGGTECGEGDRDCRTKISVH